MLADSNKIISQLIDQINIGEDNKLSRKYKEELKKFYIELGEYTQKAYLNFEIIKELTKSDHRKAAELDIALVLQLPFLLRFFEHKGKDIVNIFIQVMGLEKYVKLIERSEIQYFYILKENKQIHEWMHCFENLTALLPKMQKKGLITFADNLTVMKSLGGVRK